ncbi:hypothetical protein, partial [Adlercreutzia sp. DFI.6.23]|uniref:hypothetical protein n=1 Tax=Adlercreutzia sp. DFI.6.23 TaxID=2963705 RepID=UPI00210AA36A
EDVRLRRDDPVTTVEQPRRVDEGVAVHDAVARELRLVCALGDAVAGWFTISFVVRGQQKADEVAAAMASKTAGAAL